MRTAKELLTELTRCGIYLEIAHEKIGYASPHGAFTPDLRAQLQRCKPEILQLYSGSPVRDALDRIADLWCADVESHGDGDAAWSWVHGSDHGRVIAGAEDEVNRIGIYGNPEELNAACQVWLTAWVDAITAWRARSRSIDKRLIIEPRAS